MRLKAILKIDLPSQEIYQQPGAISRFFGAQAKSTGQERVFGTTLNALDCFVAAYHAMNIRNVVALKVDQTPLYLDNAMVEDDFNAMIGAINTHRGTLADNFKVIHLVLEHNAAGIHYVLDTKIYGQVPTGHEEVHVVISGKIDAFNPVPSESAPDFRMRVRNLVSTPGFLEGYRQQFDVAVEHILNQLKHHTGALSGSVAHAEAGVVRPSKNSVQQLGAQRFNQQGRAFRGDTIRPTAVGYYHDPYSYYYYNPFDTLVNLLILDALLDHSAVGIPGDTVIFNFDGQPLGDVEHFGEYKDSLADVHNVASEEAAASLEAGELLNDPNVLGDFGGYGSDTENVTTGFDAGDAGYFDDSAAAVDTSASSCSTGETTSSCASSSCSSSSCSSCSSCASCSSCS